MKSINAVILIAKQLSYILNKKQKQGVLLSLLLMLCSSYLELLGVSAIFPFLQVILDEDSFQSKWYSRVIFDLFPGIEFGELVCVLTIVIIIVFLVKNGVSLLCAYVQTRYAERLKRELAIASLRTTMSRPYAYFVETNSAIILKNIQDGPSVVSRIIKSSFQFVDHLIMALMIGIYLVYIDWRIAWGTLVLAAVCFFLIIFGFKKKIKIFGKQQWDTEAEKLQSCRQIVEGIKEIIVMDRKTFFSSDYEKMAQKSEHINVVYSIISACPERIIEAVCVSGFLGIILIRLNTGVDIDTFISTLGVFAMGAFKILPSISKMSSDVTAVIFEMAGLNYFYENLKVMRNQDNIYIQEDSVDEKSIKKDELHINEREDFCFRESIQLCNVTWSYSTSKTKVLSGINITIHKGEAIGIIGASGAGKTTLVDVILGLYQPQAGKVLVDGLDVFSIPHQWARTISYVPQMVYLLDDSIRGNIAFGLPDNQVLDDKVWDSLRQANLDTFVRDLPRGLDTIVGERGVKLSGGQRQRVAIARALYNDPQIIVLDEATSALDTETETSVMEAIDLLQGKKTLIIVAHRLTTIRNCNRVYEIRDGKAFERDLSEVLADV